MKKLLITSTIFLLLAGCETAFNDASDALTPAEEHPISVNLQTVTMQIDIDPLASELSSLDTARIKAFAQNYYIKGHGPITISAPSGTPNDFLGQEMAADIRKAFYDNGVDWGQMKGATYRSSASKEYGELIISFSQYVASPSECGDWSDEWKRRFQNKRSKNFGCASQNNLAAMISDPRDLIEGGALGMGDSTSSVAAIEALADGEETSTAREASTEVTSQE
ncbi:MAG: CpaD family pilus assembly protein [bacterium]